MQRKFLLLGLLLCVLGKIVSPAKSSVEVLPPPRGGEASEVTLLEIGWLQV